LAIRTWLDISPTLGLTFVLPRLARFEVEVLRPDAAVLLDDLTAHPQVVVTDLDQSEAAQVESRLSPERFDVLAGWVVHTCRQRGWAALTSDPERLQRIDPQVDVELL